MKPSILFSSRLKQDREPRVPYETGKHDVDTPINPLPREGIFAEGNMENIFTTIPINISTNPNVMENVHISANCSPKEIAIYTTLFKEFHDVCSWSYEEMPGIDPSIVEHEI